MTFVILLTSLVPEFCLFKSSNKTGDVVTITKRFDFEMAHALYGYSGPCSNIHGHSYELHVTITSTAKADSYFEAPRFIVDFKLLKQLVRLIVIEKFDHKLALSKSYLKRYPAVMEQKNLQILEFEPSVENLLLFIQKSLFDGLPQGVKLMALKLFETRDSYAEWTADND